jgi:hypothetical protein
VWQCIQHDRFRERFESQPPPKAYSDVHKFEQWLCKKIRQRIAGSKPTEAQLWSHLMSGMRQEWRRRGEGLPECGWRGWHFAECGFVELECAARGAFSAGWGPGEIRPLFCVRAWVCVCVGVFRGFPPSQHGGPFPAFAVLCFGTGSDRLCEDIFFAPPPACPSHPRRPRRVLQLSGPRVRAQVRGEGVCVCLCVSVGVCVGVSVRVFAVCVLSVCVRMSVSAFLVCVCEPL